MKIAVIGIPNTNIFICAGEVVSETFPDANNIINKGVITVRIFKASKRLEKLGIGQDEVMSFNKSLYKFRKSFRYQTKDEAQQEIMPTYDVSMVSDEFNKIFNENCLDKCLNK